MRILEKEVEMTEDFKPVMIITLELPLTLENFSIHDSIQDSNFLAAFLKAYKAYDDQQRSAKSGE